MANNQTSTGIARDLSAAIEELNTALERAAIASTRISALIPRVGAIGSVLDELETLIQSGREQIGSQTPAAASYSRPTLVVPAQPQRSPITEWEGASREASQVGQPAWAQSEGPADAAAKEEAHRGDDLSCFRLEFESRSGPLDLRTVDDAVSEHPSVRDVALLDYDGRKATLKVWIIASASPHDVQQALSERASTLFDGNSDVSIVALEDVA